MLMSYLQGCTIGTKEKIRIVYAGYSSNVKQAKGAIRIATNKRIPVTIEGAKDIIASIDLGGMYVISKPDLKAFLAALEELQKLKAAKIKK